MKFDRYIWDLYSSQDFVQKRIKGLEGLTLDTWAARYRRMIERFETAPEGEDIDIEALDYPMPDDDGNPILIATVEDVTKAALSKGPIENPSQAIDLYERLFDDGIIVRRVDDQDNAIEPQALSAHEWLQQIRNISFALFLAYPDHFLPYDFRLQFFRFRAICDEFEIPLAPGVPQRADLRERAMFYLAINGSLQEFRRRHELSPAEMCVFLEFAHEKILSDEAEDIPPPSKVWFLIGGAGGPEDFETVDNASDESFEFWQGNIDTSPGDICLMWCVTPRSYLHSVWRAMTEGFVEPFAWVYSSIWIGQPIKIPKITFAEIAADPILGKKPVVRAHFQGSSGKPFTAMEYDAILKLVASKSFDTTVLPRLPERIVAIPADVTNERDVEAKYVEPLLSDLGYSAKDWIRQLPVRMGRGAPYYPDYAFHASVKKKGEESARMVLEAKYRLATRSDLEEAYIQAKSYALRLQAHILVLAAIDGLWIFVSGKTGFTLKPAAEATWAELANPDVFHTIKSLMGPSAIGSR